MVELKKSDLHIARVPTGWEFSNSVLYKLCREHPGHDKSEVIVAKLLFIGRIYAAALERRKNKGEIGDDFYLVKVPSMIKKADLDTQLRPLVGLELSWETAPTVLEVHGKLVTLFYEISELNKRSLASKYLHFHFPNLYFIYDSRAVEALRSFQVVLSKKDISANTDQIDQNYAHFVLSCLKLREAFKSKFGIELSPRELDNLLLHKANEGERGKLRH